MTWARLVFVLGIGCGALFAKTASADEPVPPIEHHPDAYPPPAARGWLLLTGAGVTAGWYGAAVGFSYLFPDAPGATQLRIPVAGPWMAFGETGCGKNDPDCGIFTIILRETLTVIDAIGQAGGLLVITEALFMPTREPALQRRRRSARQRSSAIGFQVRASPVVGTDSIGVSFLGRF